MDKVFSSFPNIGKEDFDFGGGSCTGKWNKIEHHLFSQITLNWKGRPLESYETIVNLIGATKTHKGLKVKAVLDENKYQKGIKLTKLELAGVNKKNHDFHGEWNYTIQSKIS